MGLFGVLIFCFGALCVASATECIPETAKCSEFWERTLPHKNLISSEAELNSWCSKQARFYQCLEDVLLEGKNGNLSYLPTNLLISKLFSQDICSEGSKSRTRLLNSADCINQLNTDFCILPKYLDIVTPDDDIPSTRCSQAEKTFSCIAATMVLNCGFDAGRVYRTMLKITRYSDEVCGIETSEGIPPCEGSRSKSTGRDKKLSEMYYGLFHRMGDVLDPDEQDETNDETSEKSEDVDEVVTEAIQTAIDNLEENLISEELDIADYLHSKLDSRSVPCSKDVKEFKPYMQNPAITEVFKEVLFYNYSGIEYALYWRQPLFTRIDRMDCEQLQPSYMEAQMFRCKFGMRKSDPDCISNATVLEKVTPEFIRSFDPEVPCDSTVEFGPRPEWMSELDEMYEDKKAREQTKSSVETPVATKAPETLTTCSTLLNLAASACPEEQTPKWYEIKFEDLNLNAPIPNELYYEIRDLVWPDLPTWRPPAINKIRIGDTQYFVMYNPEFAKSMENITCSRINECDPRGRGLWKCKIWPRQIQTCDTCDKYQMKDPFIGIQIYARPAKERKAGFKVRVETEPPVTVEPGVLHSSTPFIEPISLEFSGDAESENQIEVDPSENESNELDSFLNDEANSEDKFEDIEIDEMDKVEYNLVSDSEIDEIQLQILNSILNRGEDSEVVYAVEGADTEDGESEVIIATEDGHLAGDILVIKNLSDLGDSKYRVVTVPTSRAI